MQLLIFYIYCLSPCQIIHTNKAAVFVTYGYPKDLEQCLVNSRHSNNTCGMNKRYFERKRQIKSVPQLAFDWVCRNVCPNFILYTILIISASCLFIDWTHSYQPWTMYQHCAGHWRYESENIISIFNDCKLAAPRRATDPVFRAGQGRQ